MQRRVPLALVAGAIVAVLVVLLVGALLFGGGSDGRATSSVPVRKVLVHDDFDRASAARLTGAGAPHWEIIAGKWAVRDGTAVVEANAGGGRNVAVVDAKSPDVEISATSPKIVAGWGLVFRMASARDFWVLTAAPVAATYSLSKVVDGKTTVVANVGLAATTPGTVVAVRNRAALIEVRVNGQLLRSVVDDDVSSGTKVGLSSLGGTAARWDTFRVRQALGQVSG